MMKNCCKSELYSENETMELIGMQTFYEYMDSKQFNNVVTAHKKHNKDPRLMMLDFFTLGMIQGIRYERQKHHKEQ